MSCIFPNKCRKEIKDIIKGSFNIYALSELEVLFYPRMNSLFMKKIIDFEGLAYLDEALSKGKGVLLFQAHGRPISTRK